MNRETVLIVLGVLIAASPYLGLPLSLLGIILPVLGLVIVGIGLMLRRTNQLSLRHAASERALPVYEAPEA